MGDFSSLERALELTRELPPDFYIAPDEVAAGERSLELSVAWVKEYGRRFSAPAYLAVQDGMNEWAVRRALDEARFGGIFVGGTKDWKVRTGRMWVELAHEGGLYCHVGRCGSAKRIKWAAWIGADSIDSSLPLWSAANFRAAMNGHDWGERQGSLEFS